MDDQRVLDFQHVMGNKLSILCLSYRKCVDINSYPLKDLQLMSRCAWKVHKALRKFIKSEKGARQHA